MNLYDREQTWLVTSTGDYVDKIIGMATVAENTKPKASLPPTIEEPLPEKATSKENLILKRADW